MNRLELIEYFLQDILVFEGDAFIEGESEEEVILIPYYAHGRSNAVKIDVAALVNTAEMFASIKGKENK